MVGHKPPEIAQLGSPAWLLEKLSFLCLVDHLILIWATCIFGASSPGGLPGLNSWYIHWPFSRNDNPHVLVKSYYHMKPFQTFGLPGKKNISHDRNGFICWKTTFYVFYTGV